MTWFVVTCKDCDTRLAWCKSETYDPEMYCAFCALKKHIAERSPSDAIPNKPSVE